MNANLQGDAPRTDEPRLADLSGFLRHVDVGWTTFTLLVILNLVAFSLESVGIALLIPLLNQLSPDGQAVQHGALARFFVEAASLLPSGWRLAGVAGLIIVLGLLRTALVFASAALGSKLGTRIGYDLRVRLVSRMLRGDYRALSAIGPARLVETVAVDVWRVGEIVASLIAVVTHCCAVAAFGIILAFLSWKLTIAVALVAIIGYLALGLLTARVRPVARDITDLHARLSAGCLELAQSLRLTRIYGREDVEEQRFAADSGRLRRLTMRWERLSAATLPLLEALYVPLFVGALLLGSLIGLDTAATIAFLIILYRVQGPLRSIGEHRVRIAGFLPATRHVAALLEVSPAPVGDPAVPIPRFRGSLVFDEVSFAFGAEQPVLDRVSLCITRGSRVALVGRSGAGKSTVVNLVAGLYRPTGGRILVDGCDLASLDIRSWRHRLALAGQGADLVEGTIRHNIAYGVPAASETDVHEAAAAAACDFIARLPGGFSYEVGPRGERLSGGQQQRLGLARALLRRPDVLILDEATNALDGLTSLDIEDTLARLPADTTVLVIAHRIASLRAADYIFVLEEGRLVQEGPPAVLLDHEGLFARLHGLENRDASPPPAHDPNATRQDVPP